MLAVNSLIHRILVHNPSDLLRSIGKSIHTHLPADVTHQQVGINHFKETNVSPIIILRGLALYQHLLVKIIQIYLH